MAETETTRQEIAQLSRQFGETLTSGDMAARYAELTKIDVAYNYQYIITRRMADRGLIKAVGGKKESVLKWAITPLGRKLLLGTRPLVSLLTKLG